MTISLPELPRVTLAGAAAVLLCLLCVLVLEVVLARQANAASGAGVAAGVVTLWWLWHVSLRPPRALHKATWLADGRWRLEYRDGHSVTAALGPGTRVLGRTLVLDWRAEAGATRLWLTRWDIEDDHLRAIAAQLSCGAGLRAS